MSGDRNYSHPLAHQISGQSSAWTFPSASEEMTDDEFEEHLGSITAEKKRQRGGWSPKTEN